MWWMNNAGMASAGISESFTAEQVREMFDVNVFGVQRVIRATLPALRGETVRSRNKYRIDSWSGHDTVLRALWSLEVRSGGDE